MNLQGHTICPGVAVGRAYVLDGKTQMTAALTVPAAFAPHGELERLNAARGRAVAQIEAVGRQLAHQGHAQDAAIFAVHGGLLYDETLLAQIHAAIETENLSAEAAVARTALQWYDSFQKSPHHLVQDKATDILDIGQRLLRCLSVTTDDVSARDAVVIAADMTPSDLVRFAHQGACAFVTETCGEKSHTAILARGFAIPLVTGIESALESIANGDQVLVDANNGLVVVNPSSDEYKHAVAVQRQTHADDRPHALDAGPLVTQDGVRVHLLLNISDPLEAKSVADLGAEGVGLYRTEFFYLLRQMWPSEDECYAEFARVAEAIGEGELNIRLADFGAEKSPPYAEMSAGRNPSLGIRGVRLLLRRDDILAPQVKAIHRLAGQHPVTLLLPMVDSLDTLEAITEKICRHCRCRERSELPFRLSLMVEVPAAAIQMSDLIKHVDGVSVGLNDLVQYMLAADRDDELTQSYHDPLQPAVLRLVKQVVETAQAHGKPVTMCGELAGDPMLAKILIGLGVRRFSVSRSHFRQTVSQIMSHRTDELQRLAAEALQLSSGRAVRQLLLKAATTFARAD